MNTNQFHRTTGYEFSLSYFFAAFDWQIIKISPRLMAVHDVTKGRGPQLPLYVNVKLSYQTSCAFEWTIDSEISGQTIQFWSD